MKLNKRLEKIKKDIGKKEGKPVVIKFKDGSELKVLPIEVLGSFLELYEDRESDFARAIKGKEIINCSSSEILISVIQQLVEWDSQGLEE